MKLNWFSPVPPTRSAVADVTAALLPFLSSRAEIALWVHEPTWAEELGRHARVRQYDPATPPWADINDADLTIYHLGNQAEDYAPIWRVNRQHPGIVILHDCKLEHLFGGMVSRNLGLSAEEYREMMQFYQAEALRKSTSRESLELRAAGVIVEESALIGAALEHALGVGVHTVSSPVLVRLWTAAPVVYVPLEPLAQCAAKLLELLELTMQNQPAADAAWMAGRAGRVMQPWFGENSARILLANASHRIYQLFRRQPGSS